ncbi:hypothetical protein BDW42DRAFT_14864 [Aspergillus taichungensis]|uniref:Uncharacterized protein n=1 Tax=Aspergillus taichungensis TaxID=482145 RepID=A0A2J5HIG8_9EURO|nr:hypothetical protein BDW42DRAFT_14864 [Aspergillus taichungensis]
MQRARWEFVLVQCMADALGRRAQLSAFSTNKHHWGEGSARCRPLKTSPHTPGRVLSHRKGHDRSPGSTQDREDDPSSRLHTGNGSWLLCHGCSATDVTEAAEQASRASSDRARPAHDGRHPEPTWTEAIWRHRLGRGRREEEGEVQRMEIDEGWGMKARSSRKEGKDERNVP